MLNEFLSPVNPEQFSTEDKNQIGSQVLFNPESAEDLKGKQIALIGVCDGRGTEGNETSYGGPDAIRKQLYQLAAAGYKTGLVDLGNIPAGNSLNDSYAALTLVMKELMSEGILPIVLGGTQNLTLGQFAAHRGKTKINLAVVDRKIDLAPLPAETPSADNFLMNLFVESDSPLFNFCAIAYQTHFTPPHVTDTLDKLHFESIRLGRIRDDINEVEPILRDSDVVSFDMSAVRMADAPGTFHSTPNGLTGEESCQIARFAGLSERVKSFGIYEMNPALDVRETTAQLAAQMLWYFIDGFHNRRNEDTMAEEQFTEYVIAIPENDNPLSFKKSRRTERWWMEVKADHADMKKPEKILVPCSYADYQAACREELPDRWLKAYNKLI